MAFKKLKCSLHGRKLVPNNQTRNYQEDISDGLETLLLHNICLLYYLGRFGSVIIFLSVEFSFPQKFFLFEIPKRNQK